MTCEKRILVVDDHEDIRLSLVDILEARGYKACAAADGQEAVNKIMRKPYCIVIMDERMPRKGGTQALKEIRELRPEIPVVLISAHPVDSWSGEAEEHKPMAMLTKPLDLEYLLALVDRHCG